MSSSRNELEKLLEELSIKSITIEHPEVFTVEAMRPYLGECKGIVCKNLFLKGKKKGDLWLVTVGHNKEVNLSQLAKKLTVSKGLRFADEAILEKTLGVKQGCVTPLSLFKDTEKLVQVVLDQDIKTLPSEQMVYSHPMQNSATTGMSSSDFIKFVEYTKHTPIFIEL